MDPSRPSYLAVLPPALRDVDRTIHPRDSMFNIMLEIHCGYREAALFDYYRSGLLAFDTTRQLLDWRFGPDWRGLDGLLDFGCGFGRLTRFLVHTLPGERIWSTDVVPGAVEFVQERFGVHGLAGSVDPGDFRTDRSFDAVFAYSVLTHLPERTFRLWLGRWSELLSEGGMLVFSILDSSTLAPEIPMPAGGFYFEKWSESEYLSLEDYGSTRVTSDYVGRTLAEVARGEIRCQRIPRALWHQQDLYVVLKGEGPDPRELRLERGPVGHLESCRIDAARRELSVTGWAADPDSLKTPPEIVVEIDGRAIGECRPTAPWPGVSEFLGEAADDLPAAWSMTCGAPGSTIRPGDVLRVTAASARTGRSYVLHQGSVDASMLLLPLEKATADLAVLRKKIRLFEASRFGRWRRRWMSLKRTLGARRSSSTTR